MDVDEFLGGEIINEVNRIFEGGDPVEVCKTREKEARDEMVADIFEWKDEIDMNDNNNVNVENKKDDESEEGEDNFVVGDFVWGKIKSHQWWPGQIYDPSNASDYAAGIKCNEGQLLVAYFGDGSFSWCSPSQLKPFIENFEEMSKQSDSKKFLNAVNKSLEQVSKFVGAELKCKCQSVDLGVNGGVKNVGIKEGVCAPKGKTVKVLMERLQPVEIVSTLMGLAIMGPDTGLDELELTVLKSFLSAFYSQKGGRLLGKFHEPECIEGLEDKTRSEDGPSENGDDDDKLFQRRKKKSVAELLGDDERKIKKVKTSNDGGSGSRKKKGLSVSVTFESDHENGDGFGGVEDEMMSPRQRKKSKYLSPPYFSPVGGGKLSGSFKEEKTEPANGSEVDDSSKSSGRKTIQKRRARAREGSDSKAHKLNDGDVKVDSVLNGLLRAALDPSSLSEKNVPEITKYILSFRMSKFEEGSNNQLTDGKKVDSPVTLVIEFPPEAAVPTKSDLVKAYKKVGNLIKKETCIDGSSAFVVFGNCDDAESALDMSLENMPFGDVNYRVSEEAIPSVKKGSRRAESEDTLESDLAFIKQKLETMSETVQRCEESEMKADVKARLEAGIKEVLDKVGNMCGK
ncbi:PWWP domain-containing protein 6-like [Rutidosis leptorrhynchoides]|uniref:PWWP domain-containing protein 6-like n=1 Tax=Rutidosis leptorrhynchoides TaxID=125765 RepID=UPI003A9915B4